MKVRYFGLAFLAIVVVVPIAALALLTTDRAERTAALEVRTGNDRLAKAVARQIADYVAGERATLASLGETVHQVTDELVRLKLTHAFMIEHLHVKALAVFDTGGRKIAGDDGLEVGLAQALAGKPTRTSVPDSEAGRAIGHMVAIAEPIIVAGKRRGAVLAKIDLVGIWEPVNSVKIGKSGFVRLLTSAGALLAHGNPEERRTVFNPEEDVSARLVAGALAGTIVRNKQGEEVIATAALVPEIDAIVLVEQPAAEAYASVSSMKSALVVIAGVTLLVALLVGFGAGGQLVRGIERLRMHTRVLASGKLEQRIDPVEVSRVKELRGLAEATNEMAADLLEAQREMKERERLDVFARVAAGLAHDLRAPINAIRLACDALIEHPEDDDARDYVIQVSEKHIPRLARFTDDMRRLARTGELELELERHDPLALATEVISELKADRAFHGIASFDVTGERGEFDVDPHLVKRALYNLAKNGAEACRGKRNGEVVIDVSFESERVVYSVSDNGIGIAPERHDDVLSSDFKSTKTSMGVGLGLGVVRQVAEGHGGELDFQSEVGAGTTFTLSFPGRVSERQSGHETELEPEAQVVEAARSVQQYHHRRRGSDTDRVLPD